MQACILLFWFTSPLRPENQNGRDGWRHTITPYVDQTAMKQIILSILTLALGISLAGASPASGDGENGRAGKPDRFDTRIALWQALNTGIRNSPGIQRRMADWETLIERYREATGLPDPVLNLTYFPSPIETRLGPQDYNLTLSQGLPFPGKLNKKGRVVEKQILIARHRLDNEVREIRARIIASYAELSYIQTARAVSAKNMELIDALLGESGRRYAQGQNGQGRDENPGLLMDVMRAKSQQGQMRYDILLLDRLEKTQKADLNALMDRPPDAPIGKTEPVGIFPMQLSEAEIFDMAREHNTEIKLSRAKVEKAEAGVDLANTRGQPDFRLGLFYAGIGDSDANVRDSGKDAVGVQFGLTLPLWSGKNNGGKLAALGEKHSAAAEHRERVNQIMTRISKALFTLENALRLIRLYETDLLPQSLGALNTGELWFNQGKGSFSDLLEARSVVHNFQLALARAKADYLKALARLEALAGIALVPSPDKEAGHEK